MVAAACGTTADVEPRTETASAVQTAADAPAVDVRTPAVVIDQCGAARHQYLVGRDRSEIPVPVDVVGRRVTCTTCPVTEDYSAYRLNIFFNAETDLVEQVRCG